MLLVGGHRRQGRFDPFLRKACLRTSQLCFIQMRQEKSRHASEWTKNSMDCPNRPRTSDVNASISACASSTLRYQGKVR